MSWRELFWGWRGRLNRLQFIVGNLIVGLIVMAVSYNLWPFPVRDEAGNIVWDESRGWVGSIALTIGYAPFVASLLMRRLHDIGLNASWVMLLWCAGTVWMQAHYAWPDAVPFWIGAVFALPGTVMVLAALIALSQEGANRFGEQPAPGLPKRL